MDEPQVDLYQKNRLMQTITVQLRLKDKHAAELNRQARAVNFVWASFKRMLSYKALMHGGKMIEVSERYSSQICSACGEKPPSRPQGIADLGKRVWTCDNCGAVHDRDVNAARNILRVGLDTLRLGALLSDPITLVAGTGWGAAKAAAVSLSFPE